MGAGDEGEAPGLKAAEAPQRGLPVRGAPPAAPVALEAIMKRGLFMALAAAVMAPLATESPAASAAKNLAEGLSAVTKFLPPEPGQTICFGRAYDAKHLSDHPRQTVTEMTLLLRVEGLDAKGKRVLEDPDRIEYVFALAVNRRGDTSPLMTMGECSGDREAACAVDCDGGAAYLEPSAGGGLTLRLRDEGIGFGADCDTTRGTFLAPGADDRAFALAPAPAEACWALDTTMLAR